MPEGPQLLSAENIVTRCLGKRDIFPEAINQGLGVPLDDDLSLLSPRLNPFF